MKKDYCIAFFSIVLFALISVSSSAQDEPRVRNVNNNPERPLEERGFKKENLFTGGNITVAFFNGGSVLGANPMLGYKLNDYFDAGVVLNFAFTGQRDYAYANDKMRQFVYGPGVFIRAYPVPFLFAQAQLEQNFTTQRYIAPDNSKSTATVNSPSLLLGAGYAGGRAKGGTSFYYMSILFDVLNRFNSPYIRRTVSGTNYMQPVFRVGYNIGLFQKKYRDYE